MEKKDVKGVGYVDYEGIEILWAETRSRDKAIILFKQWLNLNGDETDVEDIEAVRRWYCRRCNFYSSGEPICCECGEEISGEGRIIFELKLDSNPMPTQPTQQEEFKENLKIKLYNFGRMSDTQELSDGQEDIEEFIDKNLEKLKSLWQKEAREEITRMIEEWHDEVVKYINTGKVGNSTVVEIEVLELVVNKINSLKQ